MLNAVRFILRLGLLLISIFAAVKCANFFYGLRTVTVDEVSGILAIISARPLISICLGIGLLLFLLSLLGQIMLLQYQVWRFPLSIFIGYAMGALLVRWFYLLHPFDESVLRLNDVVWYYPFGIATALLLRSIIGLRLPKRIKQEDVSVAATT